MIAELAVALALGAACPHAQPVTDPCEGLLVPYSEAASALRCATVDLPLCRAGVKRAEGLLAAERRLNEALSVPPAGAPSWSPWVAGAVGVVVGLAVGVVVGVEVAK